MIKVKFGHSILFKGKNYYGGEYLPKEFEPYAKDFAAKLEFDDVIEGECEVVKTEEAKPTKRRGRQKKGE